MRWRKSEFRKAKMQEFRTLESSVERLTEGELNLRPTKSKERYFEKRKNVPFIVAKQVGVRDVYFFKFNFF